VGGGNLTRDLAIMQGLASEHGTHAAIIDAWNENTRRRREWSLMMLHRHAPDSPDAVVAVWGFAYIPNTASTKNSPGVALIEDLGAMPYARTIPPPSGWRSADRGTDGQRPGSVRGRRRLAIMTAWPEFRHADLRQIEQVMRRVSLSVGHAASQRRRAARVLHARLGVAATESSTSLC